MIFLFYFFVVVFITLHYNHMYIHQIIIELQLLLQLQLQLLLLIYYIVITRIYLVVYITFCWWYILWCFEILILYTTSLYLSLCLLQLSCSTANRYYVTFILCLWTPQFYNDKELHPFISYSIIHYIIATKDNAQNWSDRRLEIYS